MKEGNRYTQKNKLIKRLEEELGKGVVWGLESLFVCLYVGE
jgi:hypothetical protein